MRWEIVKGFIDPLRAEGRKRGDRQDKKRGPRVTQRERKVVKSALPNYKRKAVSRRVKDQMEHTKKRDKEIDF